MPPRFSRKADFSGTASLSRPLPKINKLIRTILRDDNSNPPHDVFADASLEAGLLRKVRNYLKEFCPPLV